MSDSEALLVESKRIEGTVKMNEEFHGADGKIWLRNPNPLGKGGYSQVYLYENSGLQWAVKRIANISGGGRTTTAELAKEKAAMIKFSKHKRFIDFIGWFANENIEYFALEYAELGDLEYNLEEIKKAGNRLPEAEVKTILTQILEGVEFMQAEGYIHRDLKPQNILVKQKLPDWQVKITDLGLSKCNLGVREGYSFTGTQQYMAPEIYGSFLGPSDYTNAIDIWAVGCIACRMLIGEPPFSDPWLLVQYMKAVNESKPMDQLCKEVPYISKDLAELLDIKTPKGLFVRKLLEPKPRKRLSARQAIGQPWIQGHDFCTLQGHAKGVTCVAFSQDGNLLASGADYETIRLWSVGTEGCKAKHILECPEWNGLLAFLFDGKLLATISQPRGIVTVWDTEKGEVKHNFETHGWFRDQETRNDIMSDGRIRVHDGLTWLDGSVAFSPDGRILASAAYHTIELWDTEKGIRIAMFQDTEDVVDTITISPKAKMMAIEYMHSPVRFRDINGGTEKQIFKDDLRTASHVAFSPNGQFIALAGGNALWLWDTKKEEGKRISEGKWEGPMEFSPNDKWLALRKRRTSGRILALWNVEREEETRILEFKIFSDVSFAPNSQFLVWSSDGRTVGLYDMEKKSESYRLEPLGRIRRVAFSPIGGLVAIASDDGMVGLWNVSQWMN